MNLFTVLKNTTYTLSFNHFQARRPVSPSTFALWCDEGHPQASSPTSLSSAHAGLPCKITTLFPHLCTPGKTALFSTLWIRLQSPHKVESHSVCSFMTGLLHRLSLGFIHFVAHVRTLIFRSKYDFIVCIDHNTIWFGLCSSPLWLLWPVLQYPHIQEVHTRSRATGSYCNSLFNFLRNCLIICHKHLYMN